MRRVTDPDWIKDELRVEQDWTKFELQVELGAEQAVEQVEQVKQVEQVAEFADLKASTVQLLFPTFI
jgi:hypothetical protein